MIGLGQSRAITRNELRLLRHDYVPYVVSMVMPLAVMAFVKPAFRDSLVLSGASTANGAEQAVPGIAVMFAIFSLTNLGFSMFSEHGWHTWDRVRGSGAGRAGLLLGKACVPLLTALAQLGVLFVVGGALFDLHVRGSKWAVAAVAVVLAICLVATGLLLCALTRTLRQFTATVNLAAVLFAGLGGALAPITTLPRWAQTLARVTPSYWAMSGFRTAILGGGKLGDVGRPLLVLALAAFVAGTTAVLVFDVAAEKVHRS